MPDPVGLCQCPSYDKPTLAHKVFETLNGSGIRIRQGQKILVKPNLLMANELACVNPHVVAAVCEWLQGHSAKITVGDSPAFGSCERVAREIGLTAALKPLGLAPRSFTSGHELELDVPGRPGIVIAREAHECDLVFSVAKVKAHSQLGITLAVKNCFGCIMGVRKALAHVRFGESLEYFTDCVAALWAGLPQVAGLCDGIVAMNITGPRFGRPYPLGLVGASKSAAALDRAIMATLRLPEQPLAAALARRGVEMDCCYPLASPEDFNVEGFEIPRKLKEISFSPIVLLKSLVRRIHAGWKN